MERAGEHSIPAGPLAVRWLGWALPRFRAGASGQARLRFQNAGLVTWHPDGPSWINASSHWLDPLGNPMVWDGPWTPLPHPVPPGGTVELDVELRAPMPPGRYRLAFDLIDAERLWFSELGNVMAEADVNVEPRLGRRLLAARVRPGPVALESETAAALAAQDEHLAGPAEEPEAVAYLTAGCLPGRDWSRLVLDAHEEGFAAVGGSVEPLAGLLERRRLSGLLAPWAPGGGRKPGFGHPLVCPSVVSELEPDWSDDLEGLPALTPPAAEPWVYDARIRIRARLRSGRRRG